MGRKQRALILCTGNSCRSQMAEGWIDHELGEIWEVRSAGTHPAGDVHPLAVAVMAEVGVDISGGVPEHIDTFLPQAWDLVITVCDSAYETCPVFPSPVETLHISFPDPADAEGREAEQIEIFRAVRDAIRQRLLPEIERRTR
ncbi:MAG: arsenate reductase ArsC [Acidobacteriota bacterium]